MPTMSGKSQVKNSEKLFYDIFHIISELTDDPGWKKIFEDAANGIFPHGFRYTEGKLIYQQRNKIIKHHVHDNPDDALDGCVIFMRKQGIRTEKEILVNKTKLDKQKSKGWSAIRNEKIKSYYIREFTNRMVKEYQLSESSKNELLWVIIMGYLQKEINKNHIVFKDCKISHIKGLTIESDHIYFDCNEYKNK